MPNGRCYYTLLSRDMRLTGLAAAGIVFGTILLVTYMSVIQTSGTGWQRSGHQHAHSLSVREDLGEDGVIRRLQRIEENIDKLCE